MPELPDITIYLEALEKTAPTSHEERGKLDAMRSLTYPAHPAEMGNPHWLVVRRFSAKLKESL